jgi:hypothetical protein
MAVDTLARHMVRMRADEYFLFVYLHTRESDSIWFCKHTCKVMRMYIHITYIHTYIHTYINTYIHIYIYILHSDRL